MTEPTRAPRASRPYNAGGWTRVQITWPMVVALGLLLGSIVGILALIPPSDQRAASVLAMLVNGVVSALTALFVARRAENAVHQQQPEQDQEPEQTPPPEQRPTYRPYSPQDGREPPRPPVDPW